MKKHIPIGLLLICLNLGFNCYGKSKTTPLVIQKSLNSKASHLSNGPQEYYFVTAKSGLKYRKSPKGLILGKFPFNKRVNVIVHTKIKDQVKDKEETLKGEWFGVEHEKDTVYVFSGYLSANQIFSDIKIYGLGHYSENQNGEGGISFVNLSEGYFRNSKANSILLKNIGKKDTLNLNPRQRIEFLKTLKLSESDSIFIYQIGKDAILTYALGDLPLIACINIYSEGGYGDYPMTDIDFEFGFNLGKDFFTNYGTLVYVGAENPFQLGNLIPMNWKPISKESLPIKFDTLIVPQENRRWFKECNTEGTFSFTANNLDYYVQNLIKNGIVVYRYALVLDSKSNKVVFQSVFYESESSFLVPLKADPNNPQMYSGQWTGELFKNKPTVIFGFDGANFGCSGIDFLSESEPSIYIMCDNRH